MSHAGEIKIRIHIVFIYVTLKGSLRKVSVYNPKEMMTLKNKKEERMEREITIKKESKVSFT